MRRKKGFTLIELIAVLVIMAILALIVTPLVLNIIRKARTAADKRSIDAYGRSIEIAIAGYLLDNGTFPTSIGQLTIEYSGDEVVCSTTQLKSDSSVYLTGCTVGGRSVDYAYGTEETVTYDAYSVGDQVSYNNVDYYVLADSGTTESNVKLLKKTPLTTEQVNTYGMGHVNRYTESSVGEAFDKNGYGMIAYYSNTDCGVINYDPIETGCTTDYAQSEVKYVVDAWKTAQAPDAVEARLITYDELEPENKEYVCGDECIATADFVKYDWMFNSNYVYYTISEYNNMIWFVTDDGGRISLSDVYGFGSVRPVITLSKSLISA